MSLQIFQKKMTKTHQLIAQSIAVKEALLADSNVQNRLDNVIEASLKVFKAGGKMLFCGNGGSAADAQHIAAELSGRFYKDRPPLFAEALHVNSSYLTAVANDYSYEEVFSRMTQAMGKKGDILIGISTSGNSKNVVKALEKAKELGMITVAMTGEGGGKMATICDYLLDVPSKDTPRIQECHILLGHILCQQIEEKLFI